MHNGKTSDRKWLTEGPGMTKGLAEDWGPNLNLPTSNPGNCSTFPNSNFTAKQFNESAAIGRQSYKTTHAPNAISSLQL